jgi:hypothetical protein
MLVGTGILFVLGVGLYLYDFFIVAPRREHADTRWHSTADVRAAEA